MKSILEIVGLSNAGTPEDMMDLIESEATRCRDRGDYLGAGEWLASGLALTTEENQEAMFCKITSCWASPLEQQRTPLNITELIEGITAYEPTELVLALSRTVLRFDRLKLSTPSKVDDLAFRLDASFRRVFALSSDDRTRSLLKTACAKIHAEMKHLTASTQSFLNTNPMTAKQAAIDLVKAAHRIKPIMLSAERPVLAELDILLGSSFRKLCEYCERSEQEGIIRCSEAVTTQAKNMLSPQCEKSSSSVWCEIIAQTARHVVMLIQDARSKVEKASMPELKLSASDYKIDLASSGNQATITCRLSNCGGIALDVSLESSSDQAFLKIQQPAQTFDISGNSDQLVVLGFENHFPVAQVRLPLKWHCKTLLGKTVVCRDEIVISQQKTAPDWEAMLRHPPYSLKPVKQRGDLYGRNSMLEKLSYAAASGTSSFLWGQKRVGKTSVLQVLAEEMRGKPEYSCVLLRMGELVSMHEGQIAHVIALRLSEELKDTSVDVPSEQSFGSSMASLVPFIDRIARQHTSQRFVVLIDEFDDLDTSLYTGERGRVFIKALRSLAESGLAFFLAGSERMQAIAERHAQDLNQWSNVYLDAITSREDCKLLVASPVGEQIEYAPECLQFIADYCAGNPYYMNLLCAEIFKHCLEEHRTFVSATDVQRVQSMLVRSLGETNFAHFWDDNPVIDADDKRKQSAENCLFLTVLSRLGGSCESVKDVASEQESMGISEIDRLVGQCLSDTESRLIRRHVIERKEHNAGITIRLPILKDWLLCHAETRLLRKWREYLDVKKAAATVREQSGVSLAFETESIFPIPEEDLLAVSQSLVYCGKQKDVTEIRIWLRQFNDDIRIETAFLLLKRLAEKGFITEGAKTVAMARAEEILQESRKRIGSGIWRTVRGKSDNLCIAYVDADTKSGITTARELGKRLRPGKCSGPDTIEPWLREHKESDAIVLLVDDFAGTGRTVSTGLTRFFGRIGEKSIVNCYLSEHRFLCVLLYAFPEAVQKIKNDHPQVDVHVANCLGEELRALDLGAKIFDSEDEIKFARDMLLPIGRELTKQNALGCGDLGALVAFHNTIPNNTLPIFWSNGVLNGKQWKPLFPRA